MIYVIAHSAAERGSPPWPALLNAQLVQSPHRVLHTVKGALHETQLLKDSIKPEDVLVYQLGANDCIYRKDRLLQASIMRELSGALEKVNLEDSDYFLQKVVEFLNKPAEKLTQLFSYQYFTEVLHETFHIARELDVKVIVVGCCNFNRNHWKAYTYDEIKETNKILKETTQQFGFIYIDLWDNKNYTYDCTHLTQQTHIKIADKINKIINDKPLQSKYMFMPEYFTNKQQATSWFTEYIFNRYRKQYKNLTFQQKRKLYAFIRKCFPQPQYQDNFKHNLDFTLKCIDSLPDELRIVELGGAEGQLHRALIPRYPNKIRSYLNYDLTQNIEAEIWNHPEIKGDLFLSSHTIEHYNNADLIKIFNFITKQRFKYIILDAPLKRNGQNWNNYFGLHMLTLGTKHFHKYLSEYQLIKERRKNKFKGWCSFWMRKP